MGTPTNDLSIAQRAVGIRDWTSVSRRLVVDCLLYGTHAEAPHIVPVVVDRGCEEKPRSLDLDPSCYLHRNVVDDERVVVMKGSTITITTVGNSKLSISDPYTVFFTGKGDHDPWPPRNNLIVSLGGPQNDVRVEGNLLVCKTYGDPKGHLAPVVPSEIDSITLLLLAALAGGEVSRVQL
ncbi:hypothetical protein BKA70DRAFT_886586 [Coprinopsis sp. MPI-PUGE-AT-0042]|nr:hypothetical protein BKA70DRAFT_886586 [Coprinopsis sp. MPI-PUGE-AT-0042]